MAPAPPAKAGTVLQRLTGAESCLLGIVSGCGSKLVNYPLLVIKNNKQQGVQTSFSPRKLYRGLPVGLLNLGGTTAVQFGTTGFFQKLLRKSVTQDDNAVQLGGAFLGGLASGVPCSLWELTMIQQQRFGGSVVGVPLNVLKEYGVGGLTRGMVMTLGRESLFTLGMLGVTPGIQQLLKDRSGFDSDVALAVGALAGSCFSATLTHPLDTIKTCQQGDIGKVKWASASQCYRILLEESSFRGLFKGLGWRISLITTTFFLVNRIKEAVVPTMFPHLL